MILWLILLFILIAWALASTTAKYLRGTNTSIFTTELNSMANNALVISSAITFSETLYTMCEVEFLTGAAFGTAPTANTGMSIWFLRESDGTNYEDGGTSLTPARPPDCVLPLENQNSSAQRLIREAKLPPGAPKILIKNDGSGQALPSSGNTLKIRPFTFQDV